MTTYKRQMNQAAAPQETNPDVAALATLGMRIRKAVSDGYTVANGDHANSYNHGIAPKFERVALPQHMDAPPGLSSSGSTMGSSMSFSEWDSRYDIHNAPLQVLPTSTKRKRDETEETPVFEEKYGSLKFNEEF